MCLFETFPDSCILNADNRINIEGYSLLRADNSNNTKKEGACICYKHFLPLIKKDDITDFIECLGTEITVDKKKCFFTCLCRSPGQNCDQFSDFCKCFSILLNNTNDHRSSCSVIIGDFDAECSKWCPPNKINEAGKQLEVTVINSYS